MATTPPILQDGPPGVRRWANQLLAYIKNAIAEATPAETPAVVTDSGIWTSRTWTRNYTHYSNQNVQYAQVVLDEVADMNEGRALFVMGWYLRHTEQWVGTDCTVIQAGIALARTGWIRIGDAEVSQAPGVGVSWANYLIDGGAWLDPTDTVKLEVAVVQGIGTLNNLSAGSITATLLYYTPSY